MTTANSSELMSGGGSGATHNPGTPNVEYPVVMVAGSDGHIKGTKNTYAAVYKLADIAGATALSIAFTANQEKQIADLWHPNTSTRRKTLKRVEFHISATAATILNVELRRITTAPTGGITIVPTPMISDHPASDASAMAAPTANGTYAANTPIFSQEFNLAANAASALPGQNKPIVMYPPEGQPADDDLYEPVIRAGVTEGYAISLRSTAAVTIKGTVRIIFTEE